MSCLHSAVILSHVELIKCLDWLQTRALNGVKQDIVALTEIPHVGQSSARRLFNEGLRTAEVIAKASADVIFNALCKGEPTFPCFWPCSQMSCARSWPCADVNNTRWPSNLDLHGTKEGKVGS